MININMEAIPKFDIKSVMKYDIKFDISIKPTTWIGHKFNCIAEPKRDVRDNLGLRRGQRCLPFNKYEPTYRPDYFLLTQLYHDFQMILSNFYPDKIRMKLGKTLEKVAFSILSQSYTDFIHIF